MRNHLLRKHPLLSHESRSTSFSSKGQPRVDNYFQKKVDGNQQNKFNLSVAKFIAKDFRPLSTTESSAFCEMIAASNPGIKIPGSKAVKSILRRLNDDLRTKIRGELRKVKKLSLTTDIWTSISQCSYISVTVHYVNENWQMKSYLLATEEFSESHTGLNIAVKLKSILSEWEISNEMIVITVTDNARNVDVALREAQMSKQPCFAHSLQLCVRKGLDIVKDLTERCRKLVGHFKHSPLATASFESFQKRLDLPEHRLIQDVPTRWNSSVDMMERLLEQRMAVSAALHADKRSTSASLDLTSNDWEILEGLIPILKPYKLATEAISGEKYVSSSLVIPCILQLISETNTCGENSHGTLRNVCCAIAHDLQRRFSIDECLNSAMAFAMLLDPRFKRAPFLSTVQMNTLVNNLQQRICTRQEQAVIQQEHHLINAEQNVDEIIVVEEPSNKRVKMGAMNELLSKLCPTTTVTSDPQDRIRRCLDQLAHYIMEPVTNNTDPLIWWHDNESRFPALSPFAREYLAVPATSVPSERIFSAAGNIATATRSCLQPKTVEMLTFLHSNEW